MIKTKAYAALSSTSELAPFELERRSPGQEDVQIEILYCGVCHSDIHQARNEWGNSRYPMVPGHEIIGKVTAFGSAVSGFSLGETVGVGCMVDSCRTCPDCADGQEQFCNATTFTYNSEDKISGGNTYGGYSTQIVVDRHFVLHVSDKLDPAESQIVVDLTGVTLLDSSGLGALVSLLNRARAAGSPLGIVCAQRHIRRVFEITGLRRAFVFGDDLNGVREALADASNAPS